MPALLAGVIDQREAHGNDEQPGGIDDAVDEDEEILIHPLVVLAFVALTSWLSCRL